MNEEVKKALAIVLVILLVIPMYASAHEGERGQKIKADDKHETAFDKDHDLKKADTPDFEDDSIKKQPDDGNKSSDKVVDGEKLESKHGTEKVGADEKDGLKEWVKRDFKDLLALAEEGLETEAWEGDDERLGLKHPIEDEGEDERLEEKDSGKEAPEKEKPEKKRETIDSKGKADNPAPVKDANPPKSADTPLTKELKTDAPTFSKPQTRYPSPVKNQEKDGGSVKEEIVEKIKRRSSSDKRDQNPESDKSIRSEWGKRLEKVDDASVFNAPDKDEPEFPADAMGTAGTMVISGLAILSGAGTAASISPTITIPKAAAIERSASFIAKTLSAVKTVFGEFLEDWAFTLQTRLSIPLISDRHKGRKSRHLLAAIFKDMDRVRYSFLGTEVSLLEFSKMLFCVLLMGAGFSLVQPSEIGTFLEIFPVAFFAVGTAIFSHEFAHDIVASRHGVDTRFEIWPLGVVVMLISISLGGVFAAFMNSEIKGRTEDHGVIYLAGPLMNFLLAIVFLSVSGLGGPTYLIGRLGAAVNITIAAYNLLPIKPVDGHYIFRWNKLWWTVLAIPCFVIAASALEGVVL